MDPHSLPLLVIVLVVAFLTPIVLHRLRLTIIPLVVAEIVVGLIIGKSGASPINNAVPRKNHRDGVMDVCSDYLCMKIKTVLE